jgi:hypothetical protein
MSQTLAPDVDSRRYIFPYSIRSTDDLPADFPIPESAKGFQIGVFLPRDHPDWFGRSRYPPRILLLHRDAILVLTHPRYDTEPVRLALSDIAFYAAGHFLLIGWLRFATAECEVDLPYNTRSERPINEFLDSLVGRSPWTAADALVRPGVPPAEFGPSLDIKFTNLLTAAIRTGEPLGARWFNPPAERIRRWGPFRVRSKAGGDLVACTNQRLIWIRDQCNDRYERYGSITSVAPLRGIESMQCRRADEGGDLTVAFHGGLSWRIPLSPGAYAEAEAFAEAFMSDRRFQQAAFPEETTI